MRLNIVFFLHSSSLALIRQVTETRSNSVQSSSQKLLSEIDLNGSTAHLFLRGLSSGVKENDGSFQPNAHINTVSTLF
jgi:hypothetical protein